MTETTIPEPPEPLDGVARDVWDELHSEFAFDPADIHAVVSYCRTRALLATLRGLLDALPDDEQLLFDRTGKPYVHPLFQQVARQTALATTELKALGLKEARQAAAAQKALAERTVNQVRAAGAGSARFSAIRAV